MSLSPRSIRISDYDYPLPSERIARYPVVQRDHSMLLIYRRGEIFHTSFFNLPEYLPTKSLMVFNNTKVIQARLHFHKESGALIEVFCLEPHQPKDYQLVFQNQGNCQWVCLIGNRKKWKEGILKRIIETSTCKAELSAKHIKTNEKGDIVEFSWTPAHYTFAEILDAIGELPIPPYLNRNTEESDLHTYQTVYSKIEGSVAAPTAGLHFTPEVLTALDEYGIVRDEITLHVGAGTFKPVKSETIEGHEMHSEFISVTIGSLEKLLQHGCHCTAVGTTSVRTIESLYYIGHLLMRNPKYEGEPHIDQWMPYTLSEAENAVPVDIALQAIITWLKRNGRTTLHATTQIIIAPGYSYRIVNRIITNFHMPKSTLLLLVSAFIGNDWHKVYDYALQNDFRFLSYGDSSLLIP